MNRTKNIALSLAAAFAVSLTFVPSDAAAQVRSRRDDDSRWSNRDWRDRDNRDRDSRRNNVETLARRAERESNEFRDWFEHNYSRRRLGRDRDNRWLKNEIQNVDEALERLRGQADNDRPDRGRRQLEDAMDHARRIDRELIFDGDRDTRFTIPQWIALRRTLDDLARAYGVRRF